MKHTAPSLTTAVFGLAGFAFPERTIEYAKRFVLAGYENPEELEPSEWYVSFTRWSSLLIAVGALLEVALARRDARADATDSMEAEGDAASDE